MTKPIDALEPIDDVLELFMGIPKKRAKKKDILSGEAIFKL